MIRLIVFMVGFGGILWFSWPSLKQPRSHGFFRFFAFVIIWGMLLLNIGDWFRDPFSVRQMASWVLLLVSLGLVLHGLYLLRLVGQPEGNIEDTTNLVKVGAYKYIRHPLYSSLLWLDWGIFLKRPSFAGGALAFAVTIFLIVTAQAEENENLQKFGDEYAVYMQATKMFIPFVI